MDSMPYCMLSTRLYPDLTPARIHAPTLYYMLPPPQGYKEKPGLKDPLVAAFAMPNQPLDPKTPLSSFVVPLESVEAAAGEKSTALHLSAMSDAFVFAVKAATATNSFDVLFSAMSES